MQFTYNVFPINALLTNISKVIATGSPTRLYNTRDIQLFSDYNIKPQPRFAHNEFIKSNMFTEAFSLHQWHQTN